MSQPNKKNYLRGAIDRFEGKIAVIKTDDGQELKWPIANLPEDIEEGAAIRLLLSTNKSDEEEREKVAKTVLNELLKPEKRDEEN